MLRHRMNGGSALLIGVTAVLASCSDRYDSCEATRSCASALNDGGPDGRPSAGGSSGVAGSAPGGAAGSGATGGAAAAGGADGTGAGSATGGTGGAVATGGTVSTDGGLDAPEDAPPVDTVAPTVVSVSPANGATGVRKDVSISIVFSEPMNRETTQGAFSSADLPASAVAFSWNAEDTVLTIDPRADLVYAADTIPLAAEAKKYAFALATTATDRAGNGLSTAFSSSFTTSREVTQTLVAQVWQLVGLNAQGTEATLCVDGGVHVGDSGAPQQADRFVAALVQFDLSVMAPGVQSLTGATLRAVQQIGIAFLSPFSPDRLGVITAEHTNFDPVLPSAIVAPSLGSLGTFATSVNITMPFLNVLNAVIEDHQNRLMRAYRSQYRLAFTKRSTGDTLPDYIDFSCAEGSRPQLALKYLIP